MDQQASSEEAVAAVYISEEHHKAAEELIQLVSTRFGDLPNAAVVLLITVVSLLSASENDHILKYNRDMFITKLRELIPITTEYLH